MSWQASVLALLVVIVQKMLGGRLGGNGRYARWGIVLVRLMLPVLPDSRVSIFNLGRVVAHDRGVSVAATGNPVMAPDADSIPIVVVGGTDAKPRLGRARRSQADLQRVSSGSIPLASVQMLNRKRQGLLLRKIRRHGQGWYIMPLRIRLGLVKMAGSPARRGGIFKVISDNRLV